MTSGETQNVKWPDYINNLPYLTLLREIGRSGCAGSCWAPSGPPERTDAVSVPKPHLRNQWRVRCSCALHLVDKLLVRRQLLVYPIIVERRQRPGNTPVVFNDRGLLFDVVIC